MLQYNDPACEADTRLSELQGVGSATIAGIAARLFYFAGPGEFVVPNIIAVRDMVDIKIFNNGLCRRVRSR
jgi:hypothetical protein